MNILLFLTPIAMLLAVAFFFLILSIKVRRINRIKYQRMQHKVKNNMATKKEISEFFD